MVHRGCPANAEAVRAYLASGQPCCEPGHCQVVLDLFAADGLSAGPAEEGLVLLAALQPMREVRLEGADRLHRAQGGAGAVMVAHVPHVVLIRFGRRDVECDLHRVPEAGARRVLRVASRQVHAADHALETPRASWLHEVLGGAQHEEERDHDRAPNHCYIRCSETRPVHQEVPEPQEHPGRHRALAPSRALPPAKACQGRPQARSVQQWVWETHDQVCVAHCKQLLFDRPFGPKQDASEHDDEGQERLFVRMPLFAIAPFQPGRLALRRPEALPLLPAGLVAGACPFGQPLHQRFALLPLEPLPVVLAPEDRVVGQG